ncbi:MAG: response regulator [Candidatus Latescibacter sp.]|nr:response regulator [Candidatus Latescibacter sp.]
MNTKKQIMVVEDEKDFAESIIMILESAGYEVIWADDGDQCFALLEFEKPDLIIMDVMMRTITEGFNVLYDLKSHREYRSIPVVIVSAIDKHTGFPIDKNFIKAEEYLSKPLPPEVLLNTVKRLISA